MIHLKQEMIKKLHICDAPVKKMELSFVDKTFSIFIEFAFIGDNEDQFFGNRTDMALGEGFLLFKNWSNLTLLIDTPEGKKYIEIDENQFDPLDDILIFEESDNRVEISGFSRDGIWEKWTIVGSQYYGEFDEYGED